MAEMKIKALPENLNQVQNFVDGELELMACPMKIQMKIDLCVEEMYINVASYAYNNGIGDAQIIVEACKERPGVRITLIDCGDAYDPLQKGDPDVTASAEEREIGGLGIFLVKKNMDQLSYVRSAGKNILRMTKYF